MNSADAPDRALKEEADRRLAVLTDPPTRDALRAIFRQTVPMENERPNWPAIERYVADYHRIRIPCLILWGSRDETLPVAMGFKLAAQIPNARLHVLERCKHSAHLEWPRACVEEIRGFHEARHAARDGD